MNPKWQHDPHGTFLVLLKAEPKKAVGVSPEPWDKSLFIPEDRRGERGSP